MGLVTLKFTDSYEMVYQGDLALRTDLIEIYIPIPQSYTYTITAKSSKILEIDIDFEKPEEVSFKSSKPDSIIVTIREPYIFISAVGQPVSKVHQVLEEDLPAQVDPDAFEGV